LSTPNRNESAIFLDLLGNVAFRQEQLDGTMAMPYKSDGKYHIEGKVHVCSHQSMSTLIENLKPILDLLDGPFLFASPLPRYLFNGCCLSKDHCVGTDSEDYVKTLLQETLALRKVCKNTLVKLGKKKAWVPDFIGNLLPACNGLIEQAAGLKQVMAADGVHFTRHSYEKIAETVVKVCKTHLEKTDSAASPVSAVPVGLKPKTFYSSRQRATGSPYGGLQGCAPRRRRQMAIKARQCRQELHTSARGPIGPALLQEKLVLRNRHSSLSLNSSLELKVKTSHF
jgi:hypothetical protein